MSKTYGVVELQSFWKSFHLMKSLLTFRSTIGKRQVKTDRPMPVVVACTCFLVLTSFSLRMSNPSEPNSLQEVLPCAVSAHSPNEFLCFEIFEEIQTLFSTNGVVIMYSTVALWCP